MTTTQSEFSGSIPDHYHRYLVPLIFDEYAQDLATRASTPPAGSVLEMACGTGVLTRHLRASFSPDVRVVATDINPAMLAHAESALDGTDDIEYRSADGTALPFDENEFDALFCQFGVMFYPDRELGYREAARVLKPGGAFVFNVWDSLAHNDIARWVHETVVALHPDDPPAFLSLPFGYHDIAEIEGQLRGAGFGDIEATVLARESRSPSVRDVALGILSGSPLATQLEERGIAAAAIEAVEALLVERFGDGPVVASMQSIAFVARVT